jgi:sarcosine oxidase
VRVVVVGGGVMGSAAAWQLARRGVDVTLLEQFEPRHDRGASHGSSRIFRLAYADDVHVRLAQRALVLWRALEEDSGRSVLTLTGAVDHGPKEALSPVHAALRRAGEQAQFLAPDEAHERWPGLAFDTAVLFHPNAGRVHADDAVVAFQDAATKLGADVRHGVRVAHIATRDDGVAVTTVDGETTVATLAVVSAGAWTSLLIDHLPIPLRTTQEQPAHFPALDPDIEWPSFLHHSGAGLSGDIGSDFAVYGLTSVDGIKVGFHARGPIVDPDHRDRTPDPVALAALQNYARTWLPGVAADAAAPTTCLYTLTPDHQFIVDRVGPVVVLAGFSGHGFKFAPAIGELATALALDRLSAPEVFALDRF